MVCKINLKVTEYVNDNINISPSYKCSICKYVGNQNEMKFHVAEHHTHINGVIKYVDPDDYDDYDDDDDNVIPLPNEY